MPVAGTGGAAAVDGGGDAAGLYVFLEAADELEDVGSELIALPALETVDLVQVGFGDRAAFG